MGQSQTVAARSHIMLNRLALADRICLEFALDTPRSIVKSLDKYISIIDKNSRPLDLRMRKQSTLGSDNVTNWAWASLGNGFFP